MNGATIAVIACIAVAAGLAVVFLIRAKAKGKSVCSCGGQCSHCGYECPSKKQNDKDNKV